MLREISREVDYIMEGVSLLQHLGAGEKYQDLKESLNRKYANPFREGLRKFEVLEQIERNAEREFSKDMEQIQYYFPGGREGELSCAGKLVLLWEDFKNVSFQDTAAFGEYLRELSEQEYCEKFSECLQGHMAPIVRDNSETVKMSEPYAIISFLMKMEIKDEEKWKLQKIFFDREEHLGNVLRLLGKAEALLLGFQRELEGMTQVFYQYWTKQLEGREIASYINETTKVRVGGSSLGFRLQASIIWPNVLMLNKDANEDGADDEPDYYRLGILFGEDFDMGMSPIHQKEGMEEYAMQVLKLLADRSKFAILSYIRDKEAYGSELAKHLNLTTATVSHHMNALLTAGLVEVKRVDNRIYYTVNKKALAEVLDYCKGKLT